MVTLFPLAVLGGDLPAIPGLRYVPSYVGAEQERLLVEAIDRMAWDTKWQRRRQPYGAGYGRGGGGPPTPVGPAAGRPPLRRGVHGSAVRRDAGERVPVRPGDRAPPRLRAVRPDGRVPKPTRP